MNSFLLTKSLPGWPLKFSTIIGKITPFRKRLLLISSKLKTLKRPAGDKVEWSLRHTRQSGDVQSNEWFVCPASGLPSLTARQSPTANLKNLEDVSLDESFLLPTTNRKYQKV